MPPWPQQGPPAPAVTRPTGLEAWLGQHRPTSGSSGRPGIVLGPGLGAGAQGVAGTGSADDRAAALQRVLAASTYSPRWPPPQPAVPTAPPLAVPRQDASHTVGYGAPRARPFSTTAIPAPQIPLMHRPNPTQPWPHRPQPHVNAAGTPHTAAAPRPPVAMDRDAGADSGTDEQDVVPLVLSDLDPRYHSQLGLSSEQKDETKQKEQPKQQIEVQVPVRKKELQPARGQTSQKAVPKPERNGAAKDKASRRTVTAVPIPTFTPKRTKTTTKPAAVTPPGQKRPSQNNTPIHATPPSAFSIIIPAATPRASSGSSGPAAAPSVAPAGKAAAPAGVEKKPAPASSPVVAVGRRSKAIGAIVRIKGRPKGWKPGMSYREVALRNAGIEGEEAAAILFPPRRRRQAGGDRADPGRKSEKRRRAARSDGDRRRPNYVLAKRSGRPPAPSMESIQRAIFVNSPATFMPFVCEWAGCCAELQNMATLRRHVMVVHGRTATTCQWRRCASRVPAVSFLGSADADPSKPEGNADPASTQMDVFREHMEYQHLEPVAWHQGDGFVNNSHLGPRQPPLTLSTLSAKSRAKERAAMAAAANTDDHGGDGCGTALTEYADASLEADAAAASTAFASYNVPNEDLPRYLLDEQGKQVTPLLRDPLLELSTAFPTPEEQMRRLRELYRYQSGNRYPMGGAIR